MLQQSFEQLAGKLPMLLRAHCALGYIPMSLRHVKVVYIHTQNWENIVPGEVTAASHSQDIYTQNT
jgi:hypothetical protein